MMKAKRKKENASLFAARHFLFVIAYFLWNSVPVCAQQIHIATVRPDCAAPGMNVVLEILTDTNYTKSFGYDGLNSGSSVFFVDPGDSERLVIGPTEASWDGRLLQVPVFILPGAPLGRVPLSIFSRLPERYSDTFFFTIDTLQHLGTITHDVTLGGNFGRFSASNTILVDSLIVQNASVQFATDPPDTSLAANPRRLPVIVLSKGPVRLTNARMSIDANGVNGGPGGGGGGHGFPGPGGSGFTGGGSCPSDSLGNDGSDSAATLEAGGRAATGVRGGANDPSDQGGGGATGAPFGTSGQAGVGDSASRNGGFGGGSGGGEAVNPFIEFGGGGGGFGTAGAGGGELGATAPNGGNPNGGRFLVPIAGGSGGGAGNSVDLGDSTMGGSGGGGGGALALIAFDSIVLDRSTLSARGDSGTTGAMIAAGGGGGSGGGIYLASPVAVQEINTQVAVSGGAGGGRTLDTSGAILGFAGGSGGVGRVRLDGPSNFVPNPAGVWTNGISLAPTASAPAEGYVRLHGSSPDTIDMLDTVRIFYRTRHTLWQSVDTVRNKNGFWTKWVVLPHDSLLFVASMIAVNDPASDRAMHDFEPPWVMSSAGLSIVRHAASPFLVTVDTLNFGTVRVGRCKTLELSVRNEGEEPLVLQPGSIAGSSAFTIVPDSIRIIAPYTTDTFRVEFCPTVSGPGQADLTFASNDTAANVMLLGNALARNDALQFLTSDRIVFPRVVVGDCIRDTIGVRSVGSDTLFLDSSRWSDPPYTLQLVPQDTALPPNAVAKLIVTYCPSDTGNNLLTQFLDERGDSVIVLGHAVRRLAESVERKNLGTVCHDAVLTYFDTISNLGNDTITLVGWSDDRNVFHPIGTVLPPFSRRVVPIPMTIDSLGPNADTIRFQLADTMLLTVLDYTVAGISMAFDSIVPFHFVCVSACDSIDVPLHSNGTDTVALSNYAFSDSTAFALVDSAKQIAPAQSAILRLAFCPPDTRPRSDTLRFLATTMGCDSLLTIVIEGAGIDSGLASEPVDFGAVPAGQCKDDTLFIGVPCGPAAIVDSVQFHNTPFSLVSALPDTVPAHGNASLLVRFCPSQAGLVIDSVVIYPRFAPPLRAVLSGTGVVEAAPRAHVTITDTSVRADSIAVTSIVLDSSSLSGRHPASITVSYDPAVLLPISGFPFAISQNSENSVMFSDVLNFGTPGFLESIEWNTLVGPRNISRIGCTVSTDTFVNVTVSEGSVSVTDCTGLNGNFASGGPYSMSNIMPNPASAEARVTLELGNDGFLAGSIYDMTGKIVENVIAQDVARGTYRLTIPLSDVPSGKYIFSVNSAGWQALVPLVVDR